MYISNKIFAIFLCLALSGLIWSSSASAATTYFICKNKTSGAIAIRTKCKKSESKVINSSTLKGDTGAQGPVGATGPSQAFSGARSEAVNIGPTNVLIGRLSLPSAGKYVINAKLSLDQTSTAVATTAICEMAVDGIKDEIVTKLGNSAVSGVPHRDSVALQLVHTTTAASSVTLSCRVGGATTGEASETRITAVRVDSITDGLLETS